MGKRDLSQHPMSDRIYSQAILLTKEVHVQYIYLHKDKQGILGSAGQISARGNKQSNLCFETILDWNSKAFNKW